jgi:alpha-tubulin suppressor-like RCC1 family protein
MDSAASVSVDEYTMVIKTDGSLWAWGLNEYGQLGDGTNIDRLEPVKIMDSAASVSAGWYHAAAIKTDGSLLTWGFNGDGQLGDGTTIDRLKPGKIEP